MVRFVMDEQVKKKEPSVTTGGAARRGHSRHKFIERVFIGKQDGTWTSAMSFEISAGGVPVATTAEFEVGEQVKLSPVVEKKVDAIIRRKLGAMCGLEFTGLTPQIQKDISKLCEGLPPFQSMAGI